MIVSGSASQSLAAALAAEAGLELAPATYDRFPDGEQLVTVPIDADRAIVVAATPTDAACIELLQLQDAVREAGVGTTVTVIPYLGYARQDEAFEAGQPVSARAIARAISTGTDRVLLVNPHAAAVAEYFDVPATSIDAAGCLADPLPDDLAEPLFLAPDENAQSLAETVRDAYGAGEVEYLEKTRLSSTAVEIEWHDRRVADRDVVLVDDIIATGGTMSAAVSALVERGVGRVFAAGVHPVLAGNARVKLARAGVTAVIGTDTLERAETTASVAPAVAEHL